MVVLHNIGNQARGYPTHEPVEAMRLGVLYGFMPMYLRAMAGNSIGMIFQLSSFGESHGGAIGGVIDGCPAGMDLDLSSVQNELDRRRPGSTALGTERSEADWVELLSGVFEGKTLGTPIGFIIRNKDQRSKDYDELKTVLRPGHADLTWGAKYGHRDHRGGGRSSARETACRVVAGAIARQILAHEDVEVFAYVSKVKDIELSVEYDKLDLRSTYSNEVRCPDPETASAMTRLIEDTRAKKDSVGGCISVVVKNVPAGLGEPVFDKLNADLAKALFSINAVKAVEMGNGFAATEMFGSENNDGLMNDSGRTSGMTNRSGGILGGISNGDDITCRVAFKPVSTIGKRQQTVTTEGQSYELEAKGRHDPCVLPRAVPIVEAMVCMVLADHYLRNRAARI